MKRKIFERFERVKREEERRGEVRRGEVRGGEERKDGSKRGDKWT